MGRPKTSVRVSMKGKLGGTYRLNLVEMPNGRWMVYKNGKPSGSLSPTEFGKRLASWLRKQSEIETPVRSVK